MGACLEYLQFLGASFGVNFTQNQGESLRLEFNPEIGLGVCDSKTSRDEAGPFNLLLGLDAARWGEALWQFGGTTGLRFNANRRIFYNLDLVVKGGVLADDGDLDSTAFGTAFRVGLGWNALALEFGTLAAASGSKLNEGDRYLMLRMALPIYNFHRALQQFDGP